MGPIKNHDDHVAVGTTKETLNEARIASVVDTMKGQTKLKFRVDTFCFVEHQFVS